MKFPNILLSTLSLLLALAAGGVYAEEHEEHGTHEHGAAKLAIAAGAEWLEIMLESPAANLVGFEHTPSTDAEKQKLADARKKLEAGAELFVPNAEAECTLKHAEVISALLGNAEDKGKGSDAHSDMDITWSFTCAKPAELKAITIKLFAAFPDGFQHIKTEWVTEKDAAAMELDKDDTIKLN